MMCHTLAAISLCCFLPSHDQVQNLVEKKTVGAKCDPAQRALLIRFADIVNHVAAEYDASGNVVHLEISNHNMWVARHELEAARPGLNDSDFARIIDLPKLASLTIIQQPLSDDAYAILANFPKLNAFRIEGHRTNELPKRSHVFMLQINHCRDLEELELKHLFGLKGTSVHRLNAFSKLRYLELDNDSAGPEALTFLAKCPNLREFELHRTKMTNDQIGKLVILVPDLQRFALKPSGGSNRLTAASLAHFSKLHKLEVAGLHQWKPGTLPWDNGLEHLASIKTLKVIEFPGCRLSLDDPAIRKLCEARPDLKLTGLQSKESLR